MYGYGDFLSDVIVDIKRTTNQHVLAAMLGGTKSSDSVCGCMLELANDCSGLM